ncbi:pyridoxal phosphate-dependent aminotransferase [Corynebacterium aquilae]|uniref:Aminotransferase n=1 Tax=Corynebacterium aquilae DSM 44791 TaxID=1431546 RepID=A0A1L7CFR7_9CORY|nr:pyridoxal phosphate-dependent aminotransferase [Corynebacterium aquilae]APT84687.1 aminotransferase [Corynebacterium aquilae DSM 44791]
MTQLVRRLAGFDETIFATMTALANERGAINLGQGFPDSDGPASMLEEAQRQIAGGNNQYAPGRGFPVLREAIAADRKRTYGQEFDPQSEVLVTVGATEALTAAILALVEPGQEVIVLEPYFDSYEAAVALADAVMVPVALEPHEGRFRVDEDLLRDAISSKTRMIVMNTPHNPTGTMFDDRDLSIISRLAVDHDLLVLSDEVYEKLPFDGRTHTPIAMLPGMRQRTITVSSAAKCFNATGWKTGWALAQPELIDAIVVAKQYLSFVGVSPLQPAVAKALNEEAEWTAELAVQLQKNRDALSQALRECGFGVCASEGGYYVVADTAPLGFEDAREFCLGPLLDAGVVGIPVSAFAKSAHADRFRSLVRFAFCKDQDVMQEGIRRLQAAFAG